MLPVANRPRAEGRLESPVPGAVLRSTSDTFGCPPITQWTIPDGPVAEMIYCINLSRTEAIQTSAEIWPDRIKALPDISSYLKWHKIVRPGGTGHPSSISGDISNLNLRAGSVQGLAQALICMLDRFHYCQLSTELVDPEAVFHAPEGTVISIITSFEVFFQRLRCYLVYVHFVPATIPTC